VIHDYQGGTETGSGRGPGVDEGPIARELGDARQLLLGSVLEPGQAEAVNSLVNHVDRLEVMLRHTTDMITVLDPDGVVLFSNAAAGLLTGHGEEVNDSNALDFIHPDDVQAASDAFNACIEVPSSSARAEIRIRHADGSWHYVDAYAENCLDEPLSGVVVTMRDICDRHSHDESIEKANEALKSFVAVASHDLRSPVAVVRGLAGALAEDWDNLPDSERREIAEMVARAADRMGRLVENLLMISKLDAGVTAGLPESVRLDSAVAQAVRHMEDPEGVQVEIGDDLDVLVDPDHLERILTNYLHNATHHGRPPVAVEARPSDADPKIVEIRVRDSGPGVPAEAVGRLFERFFRAQSDQTRGTGLGLAIVRDLARAAGGDAWYEEGAGGGCFGVSLPAA
jgi:PAS domain S-box-containing protein